VTPGRRIAILAAAVAAAATANSTELSELWLPLAGGACLLAGWWAGGASAAGFAAVAVVTMTASNQLVAGESYSVLDDLVFFSVLLGTPACIGRLLRLRADLVAQLAARAEELRAAQEAEAAAAVAEERARLALGVHDALAERIGEIALQAAGAQQLARRQPARALSALSGIEATARAALDDIRDVIGVLRRGDHLLGAAADRAAADDAAHPPPAGAGAPAPVERLGPTRVDAAIAAAVFAAIALESVTSSHLEGPALANVAGAAAVAAPLAFLRRAPLPAAAATFAMAVAQSVLLTPLTALVTPIVLVMLPPYAVAVQLSLRPALAGLLVCAAGALALGPSPATAVIGALAWLAGRAVRERGLRVEELRTVTRRLELAAGAHAVRAREEERLRVARELHDAVAHSMTAVVLQAEAAQRLWTDDPEAAGRATAAVGEVARDALAELRVQLTHEAAARLDELDGLIARMRALGLEVTLARRPGPIPPAIDHVAFCVLREALTNAVRHAAPTSVRIDIAPDADTLCIDVADAGRTGQPLGPAIAGSGNGLRVMAERVASCGGELRYGPAGRGFRVRARLPLDGAAAA